MVHITKLFIKFTKFMQYIFNKLIFLKELLSVYERLVYDGRLAADTLAVGSILVTCGVVISIKF